MDRRRTQGFPARPGPCCVPRASAPWQPEQSLAYVCLTSASGPPAGGVCARTAQLRRNAALRMVRGTANVWLSYVCSTGYVITSQCWSHGQIKRMDPILISLARISSVTTHFPELTPFFSITSACLERRSLECIRYDVTKGRF